jgi:cytochrome c peroxidase
MFQTLKAKALLAVLLGAVITLSFSFSSKEKYTTIDYISRTTTEFNNAVITLDEAATGFRSGTVNKDSLQKSVTNARLKYKAIEFYLAYRYPEYVKEHINGAPLLYIERSGTKARVLEPQGLQVLDELAFSEEAAAEAVKISSMTKQLRNFYGTLHSGMDKNATREDGITAMRMQLVRIFSLGITGFDTPGSLNAIAEAQASLRGMSAFLKERYTDKSVVNLIKRFDDAVAYLEGEKFDDLNRLEFFKEHIDPLYASLGTMAGETPDAIAYSSGWNPASKSIFANDFLNPYFYTELDKGENTSKLRELGEALFYDPIISSSGNISCASCHKPGMAFTDGVPRSESSVKDKTVLRNAPTLINAVYADRFFYDLRAFTLEQQAEHVIFNHDEFNTAYSAIIKKLEGNERYATKFKEVFGTKSISREKFSKALTSYVASLTSFNSAFDKFARGEDTALSTEARNGFNLFMGKAGCATCHFAPTFAGLVPPFYNENESEILGVPANPDDKVLKLDTDEGRIANQIYSEQAWIYEKSFKTTTVRNAGLTAPYFHNGAYATLEELIDFYNKGGGTGLGLNVINQTLPPDSLDLTEKEKKELIAFIHSLNDNPFDQKRNK